MKNLPLRIQEEFQQMQYKSEQLVTYAQLSVIIFIAILYYTIPEGFSPDAPTRSVGLGIYLFLILVLLRFWFVYTNQLTNTFLTFSVILEMSVFIFVIWTCHLQFETGPISNLVNSHFYFVYVIIAMRGLRFEPQWVIISGTTAIIGWLLVIAHALSTANDYDITWDYITFAHSNKIYPGNEFNKIISLILATSITAYTIKRARESLIIAVCETHAKQDLSKFFDADIAYKITNSENQYKSGDVEERNAAILFTDLRNFTKTSSSLPPKELIELLKEYQGIVIPIIRKYDGHIDKFLGDGILISFGAINNSINYASNALHAIDEINTSTKEINKKREKKGLPAINIGSGVSSGKIIFGAIGYGDRLEYTVIGDAVNQAAKLEKQNKKENTTSLTDLKTYMIAKKQGYHSKNGIEIKRRTHVDGISEPIDIVALE